MITLFLMKVRAILESARLILLLSDKKLLDSGAEDFEEACAG